MRIQTFIGKVSMESLKQMDEHINEWMVRNKVVPTHVKQVFGYERSHHHPDEEAVLIVSIWY